MPVFGDIDPEPDEQFFVALQNAHNATIGRSPATGTILDDDGNGFTLGSSSVSVSRGRLGERGRELCGGVVEPRMVTLSSMNPTIASVPSSALVRAGSSTGSFPIFGNAAGTTTITATFGGTSRMVTVMVTGTPAVVSIASVTPAIASTSGGTYVRIAGANFSGGCWPSFGGTLASGANVRTATEIVATVPEHAAGTVDVSVQCGASTATKPNALTFVGSQLPPVVTVLDPSSGAPGETVTVRGAQFAAGDRVTFDRTQAEIVDHAPDALTVIVPNLGAGAHGVTVTDANGASSATAPFTVTVPGTPQIFSVAPASVRSGGEVTVTGTAFEAGDSFKIGAQDPLTVEMTFGTAVLRLPVMLPGMYALNLVDANGHVLAAGPILDVTSTGVIAPTIAPTCTTTYGGTTVSIRGEGFAAGAAVLFDGVASPNVVVIDDGDLSVTVPPLPTGSPVITVMNANGDSGTLTDAFVVRPPFEAGGGCSPRPRPVRHT